MAQNILTERVFLAGIKTPVVAVENTDIPNLEQVRLITKGLLNSKDAVRVTSTTQISLANIQTVDGVLLVAGDRVLVAGQTDASENGIYVVNDAGAWARSLDCDTDSELLAYTHVFVKEGTESKGYEYILQSEDDVIIGTTNQVWNHVSTVDGTADHISVNKTNIDWAGTNVQEILESAETAVELAQSTADGAATDITALDTRVGTAEGEIDTLQADLDAAELAVAGNSTSISNNATNISNLESFTGSAGDNDLGILGANYVSDNSNLKTGLLAVDSEVYANRKVLVSGVALTSGVWIDVTHNLNDARLSAIAVYNEDESFQLYTNAVDIRPKVGDANVIQIKQDSGSTVNVEVACRK